MDIRLSRHNDDGTAPLRELLDRSSIRKCCNRPNCPGIEPCSPMLDRFTYQRLEKSDRYRGTVPDIATRKTLVDGVNLIAVTTPGCAQNTPVQLQVSKMGVESSQLQPLTKNVFGFTFVAAAREHDPLVSVY